jgi:DNA-binding transcriptional MerR regulator
MSDRGEGRYQIGELAEAIGLSLRTIRFYGEEGLVPPSGRTPGGFRLYTDDDIERFLLIKQMKPIDFSLDEMRQLLEVLDRLATDVGDDERADLLGRLRMFTALVDERCVQLREKLDIGTSFAEELRRTAVDREHGAVVAQDDQSNPG